MMEAFLSLFADNSIFNPPTLMHYWSGFVTTVQLVFLSLLIGFVISLPLAILRTSKNKWINLPIWAFVYFFRGTPLLVQLYLIYYGTAQITGIQQTFLWDILSEAFYPCLIAFVLNTAAYTTEIFRGAIEATPRGEIEAAKAYGMGVAKRMRRIILPGAMRRALPAYANEVIFMLHASSIASVVTIVDLTGAARDIYARYYAPFEAFLFVAAIYLCMTFTLIYIFRKVEDKIMAHTKPLS
ncbi:amino acid ABC transporter permease [Oleiphilus sp. HI0009]|uniref:ABC transporter permease n=1 Tax=unclassified Oleiphilus TaxID=2631174 RepID=UPI0007C2E6BC|nr:MULTISPECIES: ABC transporter permease [unclassified Oleiphilus]KZX78226.1 amino acid ABC transporter permease [Oleiphilus sp. HI0009]KZX79446.1 amino acid ABC transporter permease [Oleiphilus sp. HI0009]KZY63013.1 amino acid ABC transporter permease [Oleiphilus sp. HI0066]KZY69357.1 amino acid ABC transporter permease [Oleiphilus sp. HI0067]